MDKSKMAREQAKTEKYHEEEPIFMCRELEKVSKFNHALFRKGSVVCAGVRQ